MSDYFIFLICFIVNINNIINIYIYNGKNKFNRNNIQHSGGDSDVRAHLSTIWPITSVG